MTPRFDLTGMTFGQLTVVEVSGTDKRRETLWLCNCACGGQARVPASNLRNGRTSSCGCLQLRGPALKRLEIRTDRTGECWLWTGRLNSYGYAEMKLDGRYQMAHRVAYQQIVGPIPEGLQLDHLCRVRHCVNPAHLEPVTNRENSLRGEGPAARNARKRTCHRGHPFDQDNTLVSGGSRRCRACARIASKAYRERRKQVTSC